MHRDGDDGPISFFALMRRYLTGASTQLQVEASAALAPFALSHKVGMCQAKLVGPLISLAHSDVENVSDAGGNVLKLLA